VAVAYVLSLRQADANAAADEAGRDAERARVRLRRAALELPKLRAFQAIVKVGDETISGLVVDVRRLFNAASKAAQLLKMTSTRFISSGR
jgi:hypothetical protein